MHENLQADSVLENSIFVIFIFKIIHLIKYLPYYQQTIHIYVRYQIQCIIGFYSVKKQHWWSDDLEPRAK